MFLDQDYLLTTDMAKKLFHNHAEKMPIIDYHCHLNPAEIYENQNFKDLTDAWLTDGHHYGDHYKWRLMRAMGVPERLITGDGEPYDKFLAWADTIEHAVGNPLYEWTHLELKRFFGIDTILTVNSAPQIWAKANQLLATDAFKKRNLIKKFNVKAVCTTDDPIDDLHYHELLKAQEADNGFKVIPAFRPDKILNIEQATFAGYVDQLATVSGVPINDFAAILTALAQRIDYFHQHGSRLSDHALDLVDYAEASATELNQIVAKARTGAMLMPLEIAQYKTALIEGLMRIYHQKNWTMQFHMHAFRNLNTDMFNQIGADTGFDAMTDQKVGSAIASLFKKMASEDAIPKTIMYSLNPNDWLPLLTIMGCYQKDVKQKIQLGGAWWFNDTRTGMRQQLTQFAEQSLLPNFVGMLTDSRSFLSYPRHEYFRRVLCELLGEWVERGQLPNDEAQLGKIVEDISYNNAHDYFGFFD
ncbi:galacturonate isomerase [Latilactobacillus fuchuensis]|uniref:Uronate isomerase n=2 Tax=Latilactobacillus fuchuensis TaxID=164393 RepID=A0A2N9DUU5_9LACO|nr:galacturonate isomerase [Latilactobacillus fuchuensis]